MHALETNSPNVFAPEVLDRWRRVWLVAERCFRRADVCFVIDSSGSICGNQVQSSCYNWFTLLSFVNSIIDAFDVGVDRTRVGLVTFSNDAVLQFGMNVYHNATLLKDAVLSTRHIGGQTNTGKALRVTRTQCFSSANGERADVVNIAVVLTDGLPTIIEFDTMAEAARLKRVSSVLAVGITPNIEPAFLRDISSAPQRENENFFTTPHFSDLSSILRVLVTETCQAPLRTQPSSSTTSSTTTAISSTSSSPGEPCSLQFWSLK